MEGILYIAGSLAFFGLLVGVPLSILRSLDAIKASLQRIETRLDVLEERAREYERLG
jgi:hypothetical protein